MIGFKEGIKDSLPIVAGYIPISFAFGVIATQSELSSFITILISVVIFAGGSQFVLVSMIASGSAIWLIAPTILVMNARHLLYGPTILTYLQGKKENFPSMLLSFGLTDEVFAIAINKLQFIKKEQKAPWFVGLQIGAYASWIGGTVLGCIFGEQIGDNFPILNESLNFILPALFFTILLSMDKASAAIPILTGGGITTILLISGFASAAIPIGMSCGAMISTVMARR
jgi:4-azaleucine resistance transporter AzlC